MKDFNHNESGRPYIVFLAEDDIDDQEFLKEALHSIDPAIQLVSFNTGLKFIHHISKLDDDLLPNLIILDYNIPEINGAEILKKLSEDERYLSIPKIVWSTSDSFLYRQDCMSYGAKAYMVKPSSIAGIQKIAREMLTHC